jgi:hypothetical protein
VRQELEFKGGSRFGVKKFRMIDGPKRWCKCLRIGDFRRGFWWAERGELMVNRGNLHGFCVVIFSVEKHANF